MNIPPASRAATLAMTTLLIVALVAAGTHAPSAFAQQPPPAPEADTPEARAERDLKKLGEEETRKQAARLLRDAYRNWDDAPLPHRACDQEAVDLRDAIRYYARAHGLPTDLDELLELFNTYWEVAVVGFGKRDYAKLFGEAGYPLDTAVEQLKKATEQPCPEPHKAAGTTGASRSAGRKAAIIGGAAAGAGAVLALAGGGGGSSAPTPAATPPAAQPADVTALHGVYTGRLVTSNSVSGCGRAATAPCNATLGGSANGTPATLSFGGDLPNTGTLRPGGALEGLSYQGPANGLGALPAGTVIQWQQQGNIANGLLRLEGRVTVTSSGPCNGASFATSVEATKN